MKFTINPKIYDDVSTLSDSDLICYCCNTDKKSIVTSIENGNRTLKAIKETTGACMGDECATLNPNKRCCSKEIRQLIGLYAQYEKVKDSVQIQKEIETTWYVAEEFYIRDCNGYILGFSEMKGQQSKRI